MACMSKFDFAAITFGLIFTAASAALFVMVKRTSEEKDVIPDRIETNCSSPMNFECAKQSCNYFYYTKLRESDPKFVKTNPQFFVEGVIDLLLKFCRNSNRQEVCYSPSLKNTGMFRELFTAIGKNPDDAIAVEAYDFKVNCVDSGDKLAKYCLFSIFGIVFAIGAVLSLTYLCGQAASKIEICQPRPYV